MLDNMGLGHQMANIREYLTDVIVPHHTQVLEVLDPEVPAVDGHGVRELVAALGNLTVVCISTLFMWPVHYYYFVCLMHDDSSVKGGNFPAYFIIINH